MSDPSGLISIILPAFNCEKTLEETLVSVLGQTYRDIEIILINDASTDGTAAICDRISECLRQDSGQLIFLKANG